MSISNQHPLKARLDRIDLLIHREILRIRARYQLSQDELRGLYISDQHINALIDRSAQNSRLHPTIEEIQRQIDEQFKTVPHRGRWEQLSDRYQLSSFEQDVLVLALALDIDAKYETLYAYLNDDVTLKYPTMDLALRLFSDERFMDDRSSLSTDAPLFRSHLIRLIDRDDLRTSWLVTGFTVSPWIRRFLEEGALPTPPLLESMGEPASSPITVEKTRLRDHWSEQLKAHQAGNLRQLYWVQSPSELESTDMIKAICECRDLPLYKLSFSDLFLNGIQSPEWNDLALSRSLASYALIVTGADHCLQEDPKAGKVLRQLLERLQDLTGPTLMPISKGSHWQPHVNRHPGTQWNLPENTEEEDQRLWSSALAKEACFSSVEDIELLASQGSFPRPVVERIVAHAKDQHFATSSPEQTTLDYFQIANAAKCVWNRELGKSAIKLACKISRDDLVLPTATMRRIDDVIAAIGNRHIVFGQWGLAKNQNGRSSLVSLFSGASGVGKTMTVSVIGKETNLDVFKIDLSGLVSKYIGETEKNLDRIFEAARNSNALLFFDEADALFGKRSEVKDAHDRYANLETAYLLQKLEEHEGPVILATNLGNNIDRAFSRRMHFVIEFPKPDAATRHTLWRKVFHANTPLKDDVDFSSLANEYELTGGEIRNVALEAAFLATQNGRVIGHHHILRSLQHQMHRQGKPLRRVPAPR